MIIVKELRDVIKEYERSIDFGLGDDGKIYYRSRNPITNKQYDWENYVVEGFGLTIEEMKKIVNAFGHLGVWL